MGESGNEEGYMEGGVVKDVSCNVLCWGEVDKWFLVRWKEGDDGNKYENGV